MFDTIKNHLASNSGKINVALLVWIIIAAVFITGISVMALLVLTFKKPASDYFGHLIDTWFEDGSFSTEHGPITEWPGPTPS